MIQLERRSCSNSPEAMTPRTREKSGMVRCWRNMPSFAVLLPSAASMLRTSDARTPAGFSQSTWMPFSRAAMAISWCWKWGTVRITASHAPDSSSSRQSRNQGTPSSAASRDLSERLQMAANAHPSGCGIWVRLPVRISA